MKPEQQVCNIDLSRKLEKLGVKQDSLFYWWEVVRWETKKKVTILAHPHSFAANQYPQFEKEKILCSAFTVAELGEILPDAVASYRYRTEDEDLNEWACIKYVQGEHSKYEQVVHAPTEADARATLLIYLLEKDLITSK